MAGIRLENIVKRYPNGQTAVRDVSLTIDDGEFLVLVGPSGCGKSTLLRMIAGLEEVTSGEIFIGDRCVNDVSPGQRDIAMVFQNYALYPHMTVRQNMAFGLKMRRTAKREVTDRVEKAAQLLSIGTLLDRHPRQLSGGQRQRVALGRAIVRDPSAYLLDEPLSNLDAKLRVQMRKELAQLFDRVQTTFIYVTHDQVEAMTLGQRIVVMNEGVIQQVATPEELYRNPANPFVASFIGNPAMNLVPGCVVSVGKNQDGSDRQFQAGKFRLKVGESEDVQLSETRQTGDKPPETVDCVFGFRPEHVCLEPTERQLGRVQVSLVERVGDAQLVYFAINDSECVAKILDSTKVAQDQPLELFVKDGACHFFETQNGAK